MKASELLEKLVSQVESLTQKVDVMDRNIKQLLNKKPEEQKTQPKLPTVKAEDSQQDFQFKSLREVKREKTVRVFGYVKRTGGIPMTDVVISVFDSKDKIMMTRSTNDRGYWEGRLPIGKYVIEYKKDGFSAINKVFEITSNMDELEII